MSSLTKILAACGVAAALMLPAAAQADGKRHGDGYYGSPPVGFGFSFSYGGDGYYGQGGQDRHHKHAKHGKHGKGYYGGPSYGHGGPKHGYAYRPAPRFYSGYDRGVHGCHPVTRVEFHHGRKAKFGGTMCYDRWGQPFIVPGSRHLIHYFY